MTLPYRRIYVKNGCSVKVQYEAFMCMLKYENIETTTVKAEYGVQIWSAAKTV
jgi:hypothetical protein